MLNVIRDSLPAAGKQPLKCYAYSAAGRRKRTEQKQGLAEARVLAATRRTTGEGQKRQLWHIKNLISLYYDQQASFQGIVTDSLKAGILSRRKNISVPALRRQLTLANQRKSWAMEVEQHWISTRGICSSAVTRMLSLW